MITELEGGKFHEIGGAEFGAHDIVFAREFLVLGVSPVIALSHGEECHVLAGQVLRRALELNRRGEQRSTCTCRTTGFGSFVTRGG